MKPLRRWSPRRRRATFGVVLLLAVFIAALCVASLRTRSLYWHDVRADYQYVFDDAARVAVPLSRDGFDLPAPSELAESAFLVLDVSSTWAGRWLEPSLEIRLPSGETIVQYLERGARGRRYLNLSPLLETAPPESQRIEMKGRHVSWEEQTAQLLLFPAPSFQAGPVLVLAPHPDDAEIAAFGLYSSFDSWVVTISAGNYGDRRLEHLLDEPASRNRLIGRIRAWDSVTVPRWGGVAPERTANLGYFNGALIRMYADPTTPIADEVMETTDLTGFRQPLDSDILRGTAALSTWENLVNDLRIVLAAVSPTIVVTPHPLLDAAWDHRLTTVALIQALDGSESDPSALFLYTNHHVTSEYFPFGPARGMVSLPPWTGDPIAVDAVYSHPLDASRRIDKLFALEAQHDLRPPPRFVAPGSANRVFGELSRTLVQLWRDPSDSYSYFRRGPRPNELFLVSSARDAELLLDPIRDQLEETRRRKMTPPAANAYGTSDDDGS